MKKGIVGPAIGSLGLLLLWFSTARALEIRFGDAGKTVSSRTYALAVTVTDSLPIQRITLELNGKVIPHPAFTPDPAIEVVTPVSLNLGVNMIVLRAETVRVRTSSLATVTYDGGDDGHAPEILIQSPTEMRTADSTVVVQGYAYDDVKVVGVSVEGRETRPWTGTGGSKNLVVESLEYIPVDTLGFRSVALPLSVGWNILRVEARDQMGRTSQKALKIFRQPSFKGERWAVVVGVSNYRQGVSNLQYADDDALAVYEFLASPRGGRFAPENMRLLIDEQATSQTLRDALHVFLSRAKQEDLVVIYFSGHGASAPARPDIVYLLTHDADPERLASTAFPMHEVQTALKHYIAAERVLILADACRSGSMLRLPQTVAMRSGEEENELVYRYLQELSRSAPGRAVFTASEAREPSREGQQWGGGHGVFTYHLLEGLRSKADRDQNGVVTLGEAIEYTQYHVQEDTDSQQHPDPGGEYDRNFPLSVIPK